MAVAIPDVVQAQALVKGTVILPGAQIPVTVALVLVFQPLGPQIQNMGFFPRQAQQWCCLAAVIFVADVLFLRRIFKHHPELIANHIGGNLAPAHRATNKGAGKILGTVQHKLIAGAGGNGGKGQEGIGGVLVIVARQGIHLPILLQEQCPVTLHALVVQPVDDVRFVHQGVGNGAQPVIDRPARIIVGAYRGHHFDGLGGVAVTAHQLKKRCRLYADIGKVQVRQKKVFVQIAGHQL